MKHLILRFFAIFFILTTSTFSWAELDEPEEEEGVFNPKVMILHHIGDSHEWHFATWGHTHITIPLPVILYVPGKGLDIFMSSEFHHGKVITKGSKKVESHEGSLVKRESNHYLLIHEKIHLTDAQGNDLKGAVLYDLSITKNVASIFVSVFLLFIIFTAVARGYRKNKGKAPKGIQAFFEPVIVFIQEDVAKPNIGKDHERYTPYLLTLFFFIWINNMLGLLPGGANLTGNIAVTMVLAVLTFLITFFISLSNKDYWIHIFWTPGVPWWLKSVLPIMPIVEMIGIFTKPFSLMIRLFANITAGHIIILSLLSIIFIFGDSSSVIGLSVAPFTVAFAIMMLFLELLVAALQAYLFTLLTAMYFGNALERHEHHEESEAHAHH